jgi:hypothetical protein
VNSPDRYRAMEMLCRRHAKLDKKTAKSWLEEAELWSKLKEIEQRLQTLRHVRPDAARGKRLPNPEA